MPRFFFHLEGANGVEADEIGVEFESLEAAYLDAYHAVLDISHDMLRERKDPTAHAAA